MSRVLLVQTTVAPYQHEALDLLECRLPGSFVVVSGTEYFDPSIRSTYVRSWAVPARNLFLARRRLLWQRLPWRRSVRAEVAICELNPRILSTWLLIGARRLLRRPTILWGHAFPRGGADSRSDALRGIMRSRADLTLVYSEHEVAALGSRQPGLRVIAAPNALYRRDTMGAPGDDGLTDAVDFLFVGRLVEEKRPELVVGAFLDRLQELPAAARLLIVGDGPLRHRVEELASREPERIEVVGAVTDTERLRSLYSTAVAAVAPGTVGLAIMQAHAFGVPLIYAEGERHGPEIGAAVEGWNALAFPAGSVDALGARLVEVSRDRTTWRSRRQAIVEEARRTTSIEAMVDRVLEAVATVGRRDGVWQQGVVS